MLRHNAHLAFTHGLQCVKLRLTSVLLVYLAVSMAIQMAEGAARPSDCEPT